MVWLLSLIPLIPTHLPGEYDGLHGGQGTGCGGWGFTLLLRAVAALDLCAGRREMNLGWSWERPPFFWRCDGVTLKFPPQNAVDQLHDWIYVYIYIYVYIVDLKETCHETRWLIMRWATPTPAIAGESNRGVPREFIDQKAEQQLQHLSGFYKPVANYYDQTTWYLAWVLQSLLYVKPSLWKFLLWD